MFTACSELCKIPFIALSVTFFRPHRSYYIRRCGLLLLSVGLSVTLVNPAKTAEPIEMPFGLWTRVSQRKHKW